MAISVTGVERGVIVVDATDAEALRHMIAAGDDVVRRLEARISAADDIGRRLRAQVAEIEPDLAELRRQLVERVQLN